MFMYTNPLESFDVLPSSSSSSSSYGGDGWTRALIFISTCVLSLYTWGMEKKRIFFSVKCDTFSVIRRASSRFFDFFGGSICFYPISWFIFKTPHKIRYYMYELNLKKKKECEPVIIRDWSPSSVSIPQESHFWMVGVVVLRIYRK